MFAMETYYIRARDKTPDPVLLYKQSDIFSSKHLNARKARAKARKTKRKAR